MAGKDNLIPFTGADDPRRMNGKPKGTIHLSTRIQKMLDDPDFTASMIREDGKKIEFKGNPAEAIIRTAILKSMSGDKKWAEWLAKYGYGLKQVHEFQNNPVDQILQKYGLDNVTEEIEKEKTAEPTNTVGETSPVGDKSDGQDSVVEEKETDAGQDTQTT